MNSNLSDPQNTTWSLPGNGSNVTNSSSALPVAQWSAVSSLYVPVLILDVIGNGFVLCLCIKAARLRTPFNFYVMNLLATNIIWAVLELPWDITADLYDYKWWLGDHVCSLYLYAVYVLQAVQFNSHQLICINRIWSVLSPVSYRLKNSKKLTVGLVTGMWVYVHVIQLPGVVTDAVYGFPWPLVENGCYPNIDSRAKWELIAEVLMYEIPMALMVVTLVVVWLITAARKTSARHRRRRTITPRPTEPELTYDDPKVPSAADKQPDPSVPVSRTPQKDNLGSTVFRPAKTERLSSFSGLTLLTVLTISTLITWTPTHITVIVNLVTPLDNLLTIFNITNLLYSVQSALDPLLFTMALPKLRTAFVQIFHKN